MNVPETINGMPVNVWRRHLGNLIMAAIEDELERIPNSQTDAACMFIVAAMLEAAANICRECGQPMSVLHNMVRAIEQTPEEVVQ